MTRSQLGISVLGPATRVIGRISGGGSLRIEGTVKGDVNVQGDTEIAEGASVEGNVQSEALDIGGTLLGDVQARGVIAVRSGAQVRGELRASEVSIEAGARVSVRMETEFELDFGAAKRLR